MNTTKETPSVKPLEELDLRAKNPEPAEHAVEKSDFIRMAVVGLIILYMLTKAPFSEPVGILGTLIGGFPIFEEAVHNLKQKRMTMELSMCIALVAALCISEVFTALMITFFVLIAEALEKLTVGQGRNAIEQLISLMPQEGFVRQGDAVLEKKVSDLQVGEIVVIKPGSRVPVDGTVVSGHSFIDQASITGESLPVEKSSGSSVFAGTINQSGSLDVKTTNIGRDTAFGKIIEAVESSEKVQAPVQKLADRLAGYLVYFALACAVLTFIMSRDIKATISVIIVAGACGIAAGTPLAILGGVGRAAKAGSIVKGGLYLEQLSTIDTIVFDKTGTLTHGKPKVVQIEVMDSLSETQLLAFAATAESASEHPLGEAIVAYSKDKNIAIGRPEKFAYVPGRGIECEITGAKILVGNRNFMTEKSVNLKDLLPARPDASEVLVSCDGALIGILYIADVVRAEAQKAVRDLKNMGITPILLTGDSKKVADAVAQDLSIFTVSAEVLPSQKQAYIKSLISSGRKVAMVGDGVNDAPALTEATVGIAIGSGTDVARESADIVLIGNDLNKFVETVQIARKCKRIIMTNFVGTLFVDVLGVALAAFGCLNPLLAAFIHVGSELLFIFNSARMLPGRTKS